MVMHQFYIGARRDLSFDGAYGLVGISGRDDPNLEGAASRGCRSGRLYPNEKCLSHALNMARRRVPANGASSRNGYLLH